MSKEKIKKTLECHFSLEELWTKEYSECCLKQQYANHIVLMKWNYFNLASVITCDLNSFTVMHIVHYAKASPKHSNALKLWAPQARGWGVHAITFGKVIFLGLPPAKFYHYMHYSCK